MKIQVLREACCAQDDQLGPLEATYEIRSDATIGDLVSTVVESRFLQYSSSHTSLVGLARGRQVVRVFSPFYTQNRSPEFAVHPADLVSALVADQPMEFRFV